MDEKYLDRSTKRSHSSLWESQSRGGMVSSAHYRATAIGAKILKDGGNAVDAAAATSLALGVCEPAGSGLGGMAMMLVHLAHEKRTFAITGACRAPRLATPEAVGSAPRYNDYRSVAVPSLPATLAYTHTRYGTKPVEDIVLPAARMAEEGFIVTAQQNKLTREYQEKLAAHNGGDIFLDANKRAFPAGVLFRQPELARTLRRLAQAGFEDFYTGETAREIASDMKTHGGYIRSDDLEDIPWPQESEPPSVEWDGGKAFSLGPPGGGLTLLEMLNLVGVAGLKGKALDTPNGAVWLAEIIRRARQDRRRFTRGFPTDEATGMPTILNPDYGREHVGRLGARLAGVGETTHVSVMDKAGNAVALTQSIERVYGAKVATPSLGFLYNGFLRAFKIKDKSHPHYLRPGALARSNACPTIVLRGGRPWAALGSTGSERMASGILQVLLRLSDGKPFEALHAPRLHCSPEGVVLLEQGRFAPAVCRTLSSSGFDLQPLEDYSFKMGGVHLVSQEGGVFHGVAEPRRDGAAFGPEGHER